MFVAFLGDGGFALSLSGLLDDDIETSVATDLLGAGDQSEAVRFSHGGDDGHETNTFGSGDIANPVVEIVIALYERADLLFDAFELFLEEPQLRS